MKQSLIVLCCVLTLGGCATPGPMQTHQGPINTPVFEPIVLHTVNDGSDEVLFKEYTTLYEGDEIQSWGVFFVTDRGAYMGVWDLLGYRYDLSYKLPIENLANISEQTVERDMWVDSNLLVLSDTTGKKVGFALNKKNAARTILYELSGK